MDDTYVRRVTYYDKNHNVVDPAKYSSQKLGYLGKLGFKLEPAGKVRVFAMVDA